MTRHIARGLLTLLVAAPALVGWAQKSDPTPAETTGTYDVDAVHSSVVFRIKHLNTAYFYGRFNEIAGTFVLDDADPARGSFDVQVKVASVDTANADRDKHLKSPDFFDAEQFPLITFKSRSVRKAGATTLEVTGDLTLHGVTRPLTVKIERTGSGTGMRGEFRGGWETVFEIKRSDFGMNKLIGPVGDDVRLTVSVEGVRQ